MTMIFLRNKVAASGAFDPSTITGMVAAWDMATVYQDSGLTTAAADGDPIGGVPDLAGNGNILSNTGSDRPTRQSAAGKFYADLDGTDDYFQMTLPTGQRTSSMRLILAVTVDPAETLFLAVSSLGITGSPFFGVGADGSGASTSSASGTASCHVDNGAVLTTRDAVRDALVAAGACLFEVREIDWTTAQWAAVTTPVMFSFGGSLYITKMTFHRGALVDEATISAGDLANTIAWVEAAL